jgi:hypothetical protein
METENVRRRGKKVGSEGTGTLGGCSRGFGAFIRSAVRASAGLKAPPITSEERLHVIQTVFGLYQAAQTGRAQSV